MCVVTKRKRESVKKAREEEEEEEDCEYPRDDRISACVGGRLVFRREEVGAL